MARQLRILLVEDLSDDAYLFSVVMQASHPAAGLQWVTDGQQAIEYLEGTGRYRERAKFPIPDLVVLDLRMHRMDGFGFLRWLKQSSHAHIPVVVWTGSLDPEEIHAAWKLGATSIFPKPVRFEELVGVIGEICERGLRWPVDQPETF
jgi:CheY-like chemotaxis protein